MGATRRTSNVGAPADDARGGGRAVERNDRANVAATTTDERRESVHPDDGDDLGRSSADANAAGVSETHRGRGVVYAELRRVSRDAPTTKTLPDKIDLPSPERVGEVLTLGRQRVNDVQLDCPRVPSLLSRNHAEITVDANGTHFVTDKDTLNGTYLNGNLIPRGPCPLKPGDIIAFGGPANVLRANQTLRNSFRYEYRRPLALEAWREACTARERESVGEDGARDAAATATATEPTPGVDDEERRRPTKRTSFRSGDAVSGDAGGGGASVARAGENAAATTRPHSQSTQSTQPTQSNRRSSQPEDSSPIQLDISPMNEVSDTVQSVTGVLRNLMESRALFARVMAAGASMAENTPGDPTNASGAPTRRVEWNAVSSSIDRETLCARCNVAIPPRFLRLRRTETQIPRGGSPTMSRVFYHANFDCIRGMHDEIRAADNIDGLSELSDQERRVITALRSVIADPSAPLCGPTAS